ncbi:MAG: hypothetical protein K6E51_06310 [Treponema sp.]|nr:hypothetical protein [Treponema sp.]
MNKPKKIRWNVLATIDYVCQKTKGKQLKSDRELGNLKAIKDNYPKYVVTMDSSICGNEDGIKIVHIKDFLLQERI